MQKFSHVTQSFDGFTLDITRGCLLRGAEEVKLRPKPFDALKYLVDNPGRLISKAELIHALWPDTAVTDDSLVQCMMEVRRALGDDAQQIIKTVPRRGYIFDRAVSDTASIAPVTTITEESGVHFLIEEEETNRHDGLETAAQPVPGAEASLPAYQPTNIQRIKTAVGQHRWVSAVALLTLAAAAAGIVYFTRPHEAIDSIAVMPFVNVNGDSDNQYLSEGITDSVINNLSQISNIRVIALNSVLNYKGKQTDAQEIGRALGVRAVLMSRFVQQGDNFSITTELVDVRDNRRLWGQHYDRKSSDFVLMPRELATQIARELRSNLTRLDQKEVSQHTANSADAYQLFLKGRYFWNKSMNKKALEYYQQAIDKDSNYALAYDGLADCYLGMADQGVIPAEEGYAKAKLAATTATALDNTLAEPHTSLAQVKLSYDWDWPGAEQEYRRAIELNSNVGHAAYAIYLSAMGRHDEAIAEITQAKQLDPLSLRINLLGGATFYRARQYDRAIEQLQKTLELDANFLPAHRELGFIYVQEGRFGEAIAEFQKVNDLSQGGAGMIGLAYSYAVSGRKKEALQIIDKLKDESQNESVRPLRLARIYSGLGENDQSLAWLEKALDARDPEMKFLKVDPCFDNLRSHPRFANLLRRMKFSV